MNSLLLRSGLLSWIEIQVRGAVTGQEAMQWCRVLGNVLTVSDGIKMESVTEGQWRKSIMRIVARVLETNGELIDPQALYPLILAQVSPSLLNDIVGLISRLQVVFPGDPDLLKVVDIALKSLKVLENVLWIQDGSGVLGANLCCENSSGGNPLVLWGGIVVRLWQVVMGFDAKPAAWDGLTLRLVIWRCVAGERVAPEGEWARREVVGNM